MLISSPLPSSTVTTPSLPTLVSASAIKFPIFPSWAEIVATLATSASFTVLAIFRSSETTTPTPFSIPTLRIMGLAPAVTFLNPALTMACANSVEVVVPSPATSLVLLAASFTSCAPMFSNASSSSISLATDTPSWITLGAPHFLSIATLRPLGPSVVTTALANILTPRISACRASSENFSCFAIYIASLNFNLFYNCQYIFLLYNHPFFAAYFYFIAAPLFIHYLLPDFYHHFHRISFVVGAAGAHCHNKANLGFFFCTIG